MNALTVTSLSVVSCLVSVTGLKVEADEYSDGSQIDEVMQVRRLSLILAATDMCNRDRMNSMRLSSTTLDSASQCTSQVHTHRPPALLIALLLLNLLFSLPNITAYARCSSTRTQ